MLLVNPLASRHRACVAAATALLAAGLALRTSPALANGAFPDSLGILLPSDQPDRILAATNFGLLVSSDGGANFDFVCEDVIGTLASLYQVGPAPEDQLFAVTVDGLSQSSDSACSWDLAAGPLSDVSDVFADASDPSHVLAIARAPAVDGGTSAQAAYESKDGGKTFADAAIYTGPESTYITGVEIAKTDPSTIYLAMYTYAPPPIHPFLMRSHDAGHTWQQVDLNPQIGSILLRILAVDPEDPTKVYLRLLDNSATEKLGIYDDASGEVVIALQTDHRMSAFLRRSDAALIVGTKDGGTFISTDGGKSFGMLKDAPHLRALGERGGRLFAVADDMLDGYAVAVSDDQGVSWQPLLQFKQIRGPLACGNIPTRCDIPFQNLVAALAMPDAGEDQPLLDGDTARDSSVRPHPPGRSKSGCGCSAPGTPAIAAQIWIWMALALLASARVLRRRSPRAR